MVDPSVSVAIADLLSDDCKTGKKITAHDLREAFNLILTGGVIPSSAPIYVNDLQTDPDPQDPNIVDHSLLITREQGDKELQFWDETLAQWETLFSEEEIKDWILASANGEVLRAPDVLSLNAMPDLELDTGRLVYVDNWDGNGAFGLVRRNNDPRTNTITDFEVILPIDASSKVVVIDKMADLPAKPEEGDGYIIRYDNVGNALGSYLVYDGKSWITTDQKISVKNLVSDANPSTPLLVGDIRITTEVDKAELKVWDGMAWQTVFTEEEVREWIAAGSLYQGAVADVAVSGAIDFFKLPEPSAINRGFYWVYTGSANFEVKSSATVKAEAVNGGGTWHDITLQGGALTGTAGSTIVLLLLSDGGTTAVAGTDRQLTLILHGSMNGDDISVPVQIDVLGADTVNDIATKIEAEWVDGSLGIDMTVAGNGLTLTPHNPTVIVNNVTIYDGGTPVIGENLDGAMLQVGDWIQSAGPLGPQGTSGGWVHVAGDLINKQRGDKLYGLLPWADGAWEKGSVVYFDQSLYRATDVIVAGDNPPSLPANPVTINGTRFGGFVTTTAEIDFSIANNVPSIINEGMFVVNNSGADVTSTSGVTLADGEALMNLGNPAFGTGGWANVGPITLPAPIPAHNISPTTDVGPIGSQLEMSNLSPVGPINAGEWAVVTASMMTPAGDRIAAGSTIMVLEDVTQGTNGYAIAQPTGGVTIVQNPSSAASGGIYAGSAATLGASVNWDAICIQGYYSRPIGSWWAATAPTTALTPAALAGAFVGNMASLLPFAVKDALVLVDTVGPVWAKVPNGANNFSPDFIGATGTVTSINGSPAPTPPADVAVPEIIMPPTVMPSFVYTPTAGNTKWDKLELRTGLMILNDDTQMVGTPPSEDTLIFVVRSQQNRGEPTLYRWDNTSSSYVMVSGSGVTGTTATDNNWYSTFGYKAGEFVLYQDELYIALADNINSVPDSLTSNNWQKLFTQYAKGAEVIQLVQYMQTTLNTKIDTLASGVKHGVAVDSYTTAPPATPTLGDYYLIKSPATGDWAGQDNHVAEWVEIIGVEQWQFITPTDNDSHYVIDEDVTYTWNGTDLG